MRKSKLAQLLVVAALLAVPAAAISAQRGSMNNGNLWDGASDWPGVTSIAIPEALPETGASPAPLPFYLQRDSVRATQALPETGSDKIPTPAIKSWRFEGFTLVPDFADTAEPEALPETGFDQERALREAYAQLRHDGSVAPATLPEAGAVASKPPYYEALPPFLSGQTPGSLPESGASLGLTGRDRQTIRDQMAARGASAWSAPASAQRTVSLDGITGRDRQTIIDQLAASGVTVTTAQPEALPETGGANRPNLRFSTPFASDQLVREWLESAAGAGWQEPGDLPQTGDSAAGTGSPSDPPLIGDWAQAAASVAPQDASLSDPPLLDVFDR